MKTPEIVACKSCGASISFALTKKNKLCPFDVVDGQFTTVSHFATCDDPKRFSGKGRKTP